MRKALATLAVGEHQKLLRVAMPTFRQYARQHGYEVVEGDGDSHGRPLAWAKIPLLQRLLAEYDFVLWVDADALIVDGSIDIEPQIPPEAFQAYAVIVGLDWFGDAPCTGVWALRSGDRAEAFLAEVWQQTDLIDHQWWEQAAVMRLIGWKLDLPLRKVHPSVWDDGTFILDERWDMLAHLPIAANPGYIRHYCDSGDTSSLRTRRLDMATEAARVSGDYPRYWLGRVEQWARPRYRPITGAIRFRLRALRP